MDYVYETITNLFPVPTSRSAVNLKVEIASGLQENLNLAATLSEKGGRFEILSHSHFVLGDQIVVSFLVRRPKDAARNGN